MNVKVPFVDLRAQYESIKPDIDRAIASVIDETSFIGGKRVADFEEKFAEAIGAKHCIAVGNGTDAIYIVLKMLGVGPGDEVITVANSWISTSETITQAGAKPVFVDVDPYYNINEDLVEAAITDKTKAIIPVHLYGQPSRVDKLRQLCEKHNLYMVEDCAQAHLAELGGHTVGNFGVAGTFSFYPGKNLGAYGDAGAIVTSDDALALECKKYARHGALVKHQHTMEGINSRLDTIQAAILLEKLPHLADWTEKRRRVASLYGDRLEGVKGVQIPIEADGRKHVYHLYVVQVDDRERVQAGLKASGIQSAIHYPTALPLLPAYKYLGYTEKDFPSAAKNQDRILSLPIFPEMTEAQVSLVCASLIENIAVA